MESNTNTGDKMSNATTETTDEACDLCRRAVCGCDEIYEKTRDIEDEYWPTHWEWVR